MLQSLLTPMLSGAAALALVLGLVLLAGFGARKAGIARATPGSGRLSLEQSLVLERERRVHLVQCDGRDLLIVTSAGTASVMEWLPPRPAP